MSHVFWDTNLFVYLVEGHGRANQVAALRQRMMERDDELLTSALTLGEVLVKPMEAGDPELRQRYENVITAGAVVLPFDARAAPRFAGIVRFGRRTRSSSHALRRPGWSCSSRTMIGRVESEFVEFTSSSLWTTRCCEPGTWSARGRNRP